MFLVCQDQGYGTEKKKRQAPQPPSALAMEKTMKDVAAEKVDKEKAEVGVATFDLNIYRVWVCQNGDFRQEKWWLHKHRKKGQWEIEG